MAVFSDSFLSWILSKIQYFLHSVPLSLVSSAVTSSVSSFCRLLQQQQPTPSQQETSQELDHCDGILRGLQEMLLGFQADLGGLSGDIRQLQQTSKRLGVQLQNCKRRPWDCETLEWFIWQSSRSCDVCLCSIAIL
jgi:hypothetical protein